VVLVILRGIEPRFPDRESGVVNRWTTRPSISGWEARTRTLNTRVRVSSVANYATSHCISKTSSLEQVMLTVGPPQGRDSNPQRLELSLRTFPPLLRRDNRDASALRLKLMTRFEVVKTCCVTGRGSRTRTDTMNSFKGCWPTGWPIPQYCFGQV
jgi:hypothetical protein